MDLRQEKNPARNNDKLEGSVERVTFHSEETGYCVVKLKASGKRDLVTLVGNVPNISAGEFVEASGQWTNHKEFGLQFKAENISTKQPTNVDGIEKYLGSGMVKGIGPHFAKKLVDAFGTEVFDVIEQSPEKLRKVQGIGKVRLERIIESWKTQKSVRGIMVFLQSHGVSTNRATRIFKLYGDSAIEVVKSNPYQLARDVRGIGFKSADQIATNLGIPKDSPTRARAGLQYVLHEHIGRGHCAYPQEDLIAETKELLQIDQTLIEDALKHEIEGRFLIKEVINGRDCLYPEITFTCESAIATRFTEILEEELPWAEVDASKALSWVNERLAVELAPIQQEAVTKALQSKCLVITGGPGTGKTTLTKAITTILGAKGVKIGLCSPTGRAAKRLSECTGMEAKTIHRLLGYDKNKGGFAHDAKDPLPYDLILIDEASMVDVFLLHHLLKAVPNTAAVIFVGDVDQLPSVGPGQVLQSLIQSGVVPVVRLTQIFRQALTSHIVQNAHKINAGEVPELSSPDPNNDFFYFSCEDPEKGSQLILDLVMNRIPRKFGFDPVKDIQILCPMIRGGMGTQSLNLVLQKALNPNPSVKVERFGFTYAPGDKVMVTANDYDKDVFNGDIGQICEVNTEEQTTVVDFDGRPVEFDFGEMDILTLAYATTVHKAQGSEYPVVVLPVSTQHFMMLKRNLIYTGVTRGKKLVVLVGQKKALAIALKAQDQGTRWTNLAERLKSLVMNA